MPDFSETLIQRHSSSESFRRGREYYHQGAVTSLLRRGGELAAEVACSGFAPYDVRVIFDEAGIVEASCSCPYEWGGWCKHIVAALLAYVHEPEEAARESPSLEESLSKMDREQLEGVLRRLSEGNPRIALAVEREVPGAVSRAPKSSAGPSEARRADVDTRSIRREVRSIIHSLDHLRPSEAYWHVGAVVEEVGRVLDVAWDFIEYIVPARVARRVLGAVLAAIGRLSMQDPGFELLRIFLPRTPVNRG